MNTKFWSVKLKRKCNMGKS